MYLHLRYIGKVSYTALANVKTVSGCFSVLF